MNEFLLRFREQYPDYRDWSDADLLYGLHQKFYSDMSYDEFVAMVEEGGPVNTGPTKQPPFATLPPMVGGALDALVAFGNYGAFGLPALLSKDTREYVDELNERSPSGTMAAGIAGGLATGLASAPLFMPRVATGLFPVGMGEFAMTAARPSIAGQAARTVGAAAARAARPALPLLRTTAKGAGLLGGWELLRRLGVVGAGGQ